VASNPRRIHRPGRESTSLNLPIDKTAACGTP
jgi:hypothetical protein